MAMEGFETIWPRRLVGSTINVHGSWIVHEGFGTGREVKKKSGM